MRSMHGAAAGVALIASLGFGVGAVSLPDSWSEGPSVTVQQDAGSTGRPCRQDLALDLAGQQFEDAEEVPKRNLTCADLTEVGFDDLELGQAEMDYVLASGASMENAGLIQAHLKGADLSYANLSNARLGQVDIRSADLHGADLRDAHLGQANLSGADLRGADLSGADLVQAHLNGADLRNADLTDANLGQAYLTGADFRNADLTGADLGQAELNSANLRDADLSEADLDGADLRGADLRGADLDEDAELVGRGALLDEEGETDPGSGRPWLGTAITALILVVVAVVIRVRNTGFFSWRGAGR